MRYFKCIIPLVFSCVSCMLAREGYESVMKFLIESLIKNNCNFYSARFVSLTKPYESQALQSFYKQPAQALPLCFIALQGVTRTTTIGTQTAGANGMAITINFPGQYFSFFSGFGEYYPDGTPNQKLGVKIDIPVNRTLQGYLSGDDEILRKATSEALNDLH